MQTYKQYLLENSNDSAEYVAVKYMEIDGISIYKGNSYFTDKNGHLHRSGGPAVESPNGHKVWCFHGQVDRLDGPAMVWGLVDGGGHDWYVLDHRISKEKEVSLSLKWDLLKANPESIEVIKNPSRAMQEYVIKLRPDLIGEIDNLDPELAKKYQHEKELGQVDL
jgi:hypothetical protein